MLVLQTTNTPPSVMGIAPGLPPTLGAAIDRCLRRDPADRFPDGETMAAALAPTSDPRPALPPTLRAWIGARNPLVLPYLGWSAALSVATLGNTYAWFTNNPGSGPGDVAFLLAATSSPLIPIIGFHLNQGRRQFRAGHTLADLRSALEIARRERADGEALARQEVRSHRVLQLATVASATWLAVTAGLLIQGAIHENQIAPIVFIAPLLSTMLLGAASNALDVQFIPPRIRDWWQAGIRDRLWNSRIGEWFARRLGAPERSSAVDGGVFRPTEATLSVAAADLFASLPTAYRDQLAELPATVAALELRAAEARKEIDVFAGLVTSDLRDDDVLQTRRNAASAHLAGSVAAMERIRLDLLRLHSGGSVDLKPLTTLIESASLLGEDARRLADAEREVDAAIERRTLGARRLPTPT